MKRILIALVIGLLLLEAGRRLCRPADEAAAAGTAAYQAGDYTRAEARFRQAEQSAPQSASAAHNHAAALYQLRRYDDADHTYERSAEGDALHAARADYDRGNCAFREACAEEGTADPALLQRAVGHYETCLAREGDTPPAASLFDDARHNLELAKLILAEFAESGELPGESKPSDPEDPALAQDDPFAPSNAAHPPTEEKGQEKPQDAQAKANSKEQQEKPSDAQAKADPKEQQAKDCKECKRGGCPKCKKNLGKGPGPQESQNKSEGPKPNPGKADNGKAPGPAKSQQEAAYPHPSGKGKPGQGGIPSPTQKNGVGDAKSSGTGPADPSQSPKKKEHAGESKMVGPDGVSYQKQDQPSPGGAAGEGNGPAGESPQPPRPGGKNGAPRGAPGDGGQPPDAKDQQPPSADVDKLFKPGPARPDERKDRGSGGTGSGQGRQGSGIAGLGPESDDTDGSGDPAERAAVRRLRQAVQRIQNARDGRQPPPAAGKGETPGSDRRRDW
jgi:hypothetical protein